MPSTPYHIMFLVRLLQGKEGGVRGAVGSPLPATGSVRSLGHWAEPAILDHWPCLCLHFPTPRTGGTASGEM